MTSSPYFQAILAILAPKLCPPNIQAFMARTACHETPHVGGCGIRIFLWSFFFCVFVVPNFQTFVPKNAEGWDIKTINPLKLAWLVDRCWPFLERYTDHAKKLLEEGCQVAPSIFPFLVLQIPAYSFLVFKCLLPFQHSMIWWQSASIQSPCLSRAKKTMDGRKWIFSKYIRTPTTHSMNVQTQDHSLSACIVSPAVIISTAVIMAPTVIAAIVLPIMAPMVIMARAVIVSRAVIAASMVIMARAVVVSAVAVALHLGWWV